MKNVDEPRELSSSFYSLGHYMTEVIVDNYESYKGHHNILDGSVPFFKFYNELIESILLLAKIVGE